MLQLVFVSLMVAMVQEAEASVRVAVLPTQIDSAAASAVPNVFQVHLMRLLQRQPGISAISHEDVQALLSYEQQRLLFDCDELSWLARAAGNRS